jgi:TPR repeat protein
MRQSHEIPRETRSSFELPPNKLQRSRSEHLDDSKSSSADSASTIRPLTARTTATKATDSEQPVDESVEEHVEKGIECHEKGSLQESTFHLRIAAKQNHPIGMLLYALACRHGWGMRPNQREGVQWLRKAVDSAGLEVGEDEDEAGGGKDAAARKARRAQFALGIYELGVSHLNGWGIEQDKALALRCFEIAARWGDADALAEAGFCYAQGVGCKKDLKKAARYYRKAEAKGMSMVGNSWYVIISQRFIHLNIGSSED